MATRTPAHGDPHDRPVLLRVEDLHVGFGGVTALAGPSFEVQERRVCGLIGPNGAGKTTLFNAMTRLVEPRSGRILLDGQDLLARRPHEVARLGVARTFQNLGLFGQMTVRENVMVAANAQLRPSFAAATLGLPVTRRRERGLTMQADALLERLGLAAVAGHPAAGLPYGTLKRIELARALAAKPRLLLLDEPASGLSHAEVDALAELLLALRNDESLTIVLVEHHMGMVMRVSDQVVVLDFGRKIADGPPGEVRSNPEVIAAYLGADDAAA